MHPAALSLVKGSLRLFQTKANPVYKIDIPGLGVSAVTE